MAVLESKIDIFLIGKNLKQSCNYWQDMHNQHKFGENHIQILPHEFSLYKDWSIWIKGGSFSDTKNAQKYFETWQCSKV
jgi:hypothetical protein